MATITEQSPAPMIYADAISIEVKTGVVWCHVLTRHGDDDFHRQAVVVLTIENFTKALGEANLAAVLGGVAPSGAPRIISH